MISVDAQIHVENLAILQQAVREGMVEGLTQAGKFIVDLASQLAPKDSGDLSQSGESHVEGTTLVISFGNGLPDDRALAQEFGTIYMPAQPYIHPAINNIDIVEEVAKAVKARLV